MVVVLNLFSNFKLVKRCKTSSNMLLKKYFSNNNEGASKSETPSYYSNTFLKSKSNIEFSEI